MYVETGLVLLSLLNGYNQAQNAKAGGYARADEAERLIAETDLTRHFNRKERNKTTFQNKLQVLEAGLDVAGKKGLEGHRIAENIRSETASSGVALGSGTAREVLANQHLQNANEQLSIMGKTQARLKTIQQNAIAVNKMEDFKADMQIAKYKRAASRARSGADTMFQANMLNTFSNAAGVYAQSGGKFDTANSNINSFILSLFS